MDKTLNRYLAKGEYGGTTYEVEVEHWTGGTYYVANVYVPELPPLRDHDHSFETLQEAFDAGHVIARGLIGGT